MTDHRPVRFGFLGAGWIAHRALGPAVHAADGAVLQAAAARDGERAAALQPAGRSYGGPQAYPALLQDPSVDVVYVCLANDAHLPWVLAGLAAGKHVLCEKPLGLDVAEVLAARAAAEAAGRLLVEASWYRWHPRTRRLAGLVGSGALGAVGDVQAEFSFDAPPSQLAGSYRLDPARGGGALYDVGCYPVSAAHLLLGPDLSVTGASTVPGPTGVDLSSTATLRARSGMHAGGQASIRCGIQGAAARQVLQVTGSLASARLVGPDGAEGEAFTSWQAGSVLELTGADGRRHQERFAPVDAYRLMVEAMATSVGGGQEFLVGLDHSVAVARTLDAIRAVPRPGSPAVGAG